MKRALCSALLGALALGGCASGGAMNATGASNACASNRSSYHHVEVYIPRASVTRVLGMRDSRSGEHEGFLIEASGNVYKVEDNTDITGPIPLRRGDTLSLLGQFECNDNVIHWTHHDPRGRHPAGYIEVNGKRYQ